MKERRLGVGITFSTTYQQFKQIRDLSKASGVSASELIRDILAEYFDNIQQKGEMPMDD